jgi:magnesium transporter
MSEVKNTSFEDCLQKLMGSLEASLYEEATTQFANLIRHNICQIVHVQTFGGLND